LFHSIGHFSVLTLILPLTLFTIKVILVPRYIKKIIFDLEIKRTIESSMRQFSFLLLVLFSMAVIFFVSNSLSKSVKIDIIPFASGFSSVVIGLFVIMLRKKLIVHVIGFLVMENGIFLFGSALSFKIPLMIELGALLDVFVVVFLMGIALNKISSTFSGFDITELRRLKD